MTTSSSVQGEIMDLDLNQQPSPDSESPNNTGLVTEIAPWLNNLETAHERIEERIRQLETIVSRIRQRETATTTPLEIAATAGGSTAGVIHERSRERMVENGNENQKYLIAKALNMEKTSTVPGGYFDCNICLEKAEDPILTCCGHLFCWGCFYHLPLIYLNIKECPVCDGEVTDTEVIPIYGNGDDCDGTKLKLEDCGIRLPPRPNAKRVESVRQKIINRAIPFIPVHDTSEQIRTFDPIGLQALAQGAEFGLTNIITNAGDNLRLLRRQQQSFGPLRLLPPHMPPFASFPSLVVHASETPLLDDNAFDVDSLVDAPSLRRNRRRSARLAEIGGPSPREFAVPGASAATRSQTVNPTTEVVTTTSASSSRRRGNDVNNNGPRTRSRRRLR